MADTGQLLENLRSSAEYTKILIEQNPILEPKLWHIPPLLRAAVAEIERLRGIRNAR